MPGIRFPSCLTCVVAAVLLSAAAAPRVVAQQPKPLCSQRFKAKDADFLLEVTLGVHSMKPPGYKADEPGMRGDLIEVRKTPADDPKQPAVVLWRNFYRHETLTPEVRRWSAALGPTPSPNEVCLAFSSGRAVHVFRVSLTGKPRPLPVLPEGFEKIKEFRILSAEESRQHYAKLFQELGLLGVSDEAWQAALRQFADYQIRALKLGLEGRNVVLTTSDPKDQSLRFELDWDKRHWRFVSARDMKNAEAAVAVPQPPERPAEVEGVLWLRGALRDASELAAGKQVIVARPKAPLTGVVVYVPEITAADVFLPDDRLKKLAQDLNGRPVKITGEIRRIITVSPWFGDEKYGQYIPAPKGKPVWLPTALAEELPVIRHVVWAKTIEPVGPKPQPLLGEPASKPGKPGDEQFLTFQRLPRSADVTSVKLHSYPNAHSQDVKHLTVGNFPAVLDGLKAIKGDDEGIRLEARAGWYDCEFATSEGEFHMRLYLGGRAILQAPDGRRGWVEFGHPK